MDLCCLSSRSHMFLPLQKRFSIDGIASDEDDYRLAGAAFYATVSRIVLF
jgi:hypothetical protein